MDRREKAIMLRHLQAIAIGKAENLAKYDPGDVKSAKKISVMPPKK